MNNSQETGKDKNCINDAGSIESLSAMIAKLDLPDLENAKQIWQDGMYSEIDFWDSYFETKGLEWADSYEMRFDPELPFQARPEALLPDQSECDILDVGAGPLTFLGKKCVGKKLNITAADPLADKYDLIFKKYDIPEPPVKTQKICGEELTDFFNSSTFDLVVARNCIDHAFSPETAILKMIEVEKQGCYVLLEHRENEALTANYLGLHQWNFSMSADGDFLISSKNATVNMTEKYKEYCKITCEIIEEPDDGEWLITKILKK